MAEDNPCRCDVCGCFHQSDCEYIECECCLYMCSAGDFEEAVNAGFIDPAPEPICDCLDCQCEDNELCVTSQCPCCSETCW